MHPEANICRCGILYALPCRNFHWSSNCESRKFCQGSKSLLVRLRNFRHPNCYQISLCRLYGTGTCWKFTVNITDSSLCL